MDTFQPQHRLKIPGEKYVQDIFWFSDVYPYMCKVNKDSDDPSFCHFWLLLCKISEGPSSWSQLSPRNKKHTEVITVVWSHMLEMFCYVAREKQNIYFQRELINNVGFSNNTNASFLKQCLCVTRYIKHRKESQSTLTEQSSLLRCNNNKKNQRESL